MGLLLHRYSVQREWNATWKCNRRKRQLPNRGKRWSMHTKKKQNKKTKKELNSKEIKTMLRQKTSLSRRDSNMRSFVEWHCQTNWNAAKIWWFSVCVSSWRHSKLLTIFRMCFYKAPYRYILYIYKVNSSHGIQSTNKSNAR